MARPSTDPALDAALAPYDYELPDDRVARFPPPRREDARLLVVGRPPTVPHRDALIPDLERLARPGDVFVVNDVLVHRARLRAFRESGGAVEVLLAAPVLVREGAWHALVRPGRRLRSGERLRCGEGAVRLLDRAPDGTWEVACEPDADTLTRSAGEVPLPPYLGRAAEPEDAERYQTIFAAGGGEGMRGAAAPTAGLHFTHALVRTLRARGVHFARVTLEVGAGTFQPLGPEALATGQLHAERFFVPSASWSLVTAARAAGCRVVAVGTTAARVLESAEGPGAGVTRLFIRPGYEFRRVDVLLTNFHLPRSSLLMLVSAFGGHARLRDAYRHAIAGSYRFFSYGDAMWLEPESPPAPD